MQHPDYNSPNELKQVLDVNGFSMQKKFGQNFLINADARKKLIDNLDIDENSVVWEVGPGLGAMTNEILERGANLTVFEIDRGFASLINQFFDDYSQKDKFKIVEGDVLNPPQNWKERQFHHVVTNPPYFTETPKRQNDVTATAHAEQVPLSKWLDFCIKKVRAKGTLTIIHRTEAVPEILSALNGRMGKITLIPLYPKNGIEPKRIIIQATMNSKTPFSLHKGFILHNDDDTRTDLMEEIMRRGGILK